MSKDIKKSLLQSLNNLIDQSNQSNQSNQYNQMGGKKRYSQQDVDQIMTTSMQHIYDLYVAKERENQALEYQLLQLQSKGITVQNLPTGSIIRAPQSTTIGTVPAKNILSGDFVKGTKYETFAEIFNSVYNDDLKIENTGTYIKIYFTKNGAKIINKFFGIKISSINNFELLSFSGSVDKYVGYKLDTDKVFEINSPTVSKKSPSSEIIFDKTDPKLIEIKVQIKGGEYTDVDFKSSSDTLKFKVNDAKCLFIQFTNTEINNYVIEPNLIDEIHNKFSAGAYIPEESDLSGIDKLITLSSTAKAYKKLLALYINKKLNGSVGKDIIKSGEIGIDINNPAQLYDENNYN